MTYQTSWKQMTEMTKSVKRMLETTQEDEQERQFGWSYWRQEARAPLNRKWRAFWVYHACSKWAWRHCRERRHILAKTILFRALEELIVWRLRLSYKCNWIFSMKLIKGDMRDFLIGSVHFYCSTFGFEISWKKYQCGGLHKIISPAQNFEFNWSQTD